MIADRLEMRHQEIQYSEKTSRVTLSILVTPGRVVAFEQLASIEFHSPREGLQDLSLERRRETRHETSSRQLELADVEDDLLAQDSPHPLASKCEEHIVRYQAPELAAKHPECLPKGMSLVPLSPEHFGQVVAAVFPFGMK